MSSDYDSRDDTEEDEEDERSHKSTLTDVKREIRTVVANRKKSLLVEGTTKKVRLTEEDVNQLFEKFPNITQVTQEGLASTPTILHAIIDMVRSDEDDNIDSVTVKALVQRLVQHSTHLLRIINDENHNPLYLAIIRKRRHLAEYMVSGCPEEDSNRRKLAEAIEDCRGNPQGKNCLHWAFEKDMKTDTLRRMVREASTKALEAVDATGRRPMHYAVQYQHCNIDVIREFIDRDNELVELQKQSSLRKPTKTFMDVDKEKTHTSVYNELVSSARLHNEEHKLRKETSDQKKKKDLSSTTVEERGKQVREKEDDAIKGRNATTQSKSELKFEPKPDNRSAVRPDHAGLAGLRDSRNAQEQAGKLRDRNREKNNIDNEDFLGRERLREMAKHMQVGTSAKQERERNSARRDMSSTRDGQSLGPPNSRDPLPIQTTFTSTAVTKPSGEITANTPKLLKRVPTMVGEISGDKPDKKSRQTTMATKKPQKHVDHETAERVSRTVLRMLKLHYMRTRNIERATWWLYRTNPQDVQTFFEYDKLPSEIKEDLFEKAFQSTKFDEFLNFVHFTNVTVIRRQKANSKNQRPNGGSGRRDMEFFFDFLHKKGVRHILKVSVEEGGQSVHSDEAIKKALDRITVEHLDWRKVDLDPQIICGISSQAEVNLDKNEFELGSTNQLRQLDLQWSGNTAVLRAWSEPEGLPSLPNLRTVNIIVPNNTVLYDSPEWILKKKNEFEERLNKYRSASGSQQEVHLSSSTPGHRKVTVNLSGLESATGKKAAVGSLQSGPTQGRTSQTDSQKIINTHEWLKCMDAFARNINPLWTSTRANFLSSIGSASSGLNHETAFTRERLENEVVVALIDDGVSLLDQNFVGRVLEGKTFDYSESGVGQSYNSEHGHGTEMARCILRVCPMAKIYPIRLKTHAPLERKIQIDLESAALAIRAALEKNASIISMSWTIPVPKDHPAKDRFEAAVRDAVSRNVLMFCSSTDGGQFKTKDYPSAVQREKIFRIGAAHDHGTASEQTGDDVDFIFPGVKVNINATSQATGSSVATALAAGLAATIIYCFKISALAVKTQIQNMSFNKISQPGFTESALVKLWQHETMKTALGNIGWVNKERFIQIWDKFQPVVEGLEDPDKTDDHDHKVRCIMDLCNQLVVL